MWISLLWLLLHVINSEQGTLQQFPGVQILGTVLNKTVSTGDDSWGVPWNELPPSLQVYGIGDIRFGFICYNVLAGILARDLFPEPEIVCKTLKTEQRGAISWILEWIS